MAADIIHSIGTSSRDYSTIASWNAAMPTDLTVSRASTFGAGSTVATAVLDAGASAVDSFYNGLALTNLNTGENRCVTAYVGATKTCTVGTNNGSAANWAVAPVAGQSFSCGNTGYVGQLYKDSVFTLTSGVSIASGVTQGSPNAIAKLTTGAGQSWIDGFVAGSTRLYPNAVSGVELNCSTAYVVQLKTNGPMLIEKTQHASSNLTNNGYSVISCADSTRTAVVRNVQAVIANAATIFGSSNVGMIFVNCLGVDDTSGSSQVFAGAYGAQFHNCSAVRPSNLTTASVGFVDGGVGTQVLKNCSSFGFTTAYSGTFGTANNNASDQASPPGTSGQASKTYANQYVQTSAASVPDFTVKAGSDLANNGVRDQTFTNDLDIALRARSITTPTIGAYEFIVSGVSGLIAIGSAGGFGGGISTPASGSAG